MFYLTDTFKLSGSSNNLICDGVNPKQSNCTKTGIAWDSDKRVKFRAPSLTETTKNMWWNASYGNEQGHLIPKLWDDDDKTQPNEDLIVWVRTAALPNFRKLYRIINVDLPRGTYYLDVTQSKFFIFCFDG